MATETARAGLVLKPGELAHLLVEIFECGGDMTQVSVTGIGRLTQRFWVPTALLRPIAGMTEAMIVAGRSAAMQCLDESSTSYCEVVARTVYTAMEKAR